MTEPSPARRVGLHRDRRAPVHRLQAPRPLRSESRKKVAARSRVREARRRVLPHGARSGSDAGSLKTTAEYDAKTDTWVLNGTKQWISNGGFATFFSVSRACPRAAGRPQGISCFAVITTPTARSRPQPRGGGEEARSLRLLDVPDHLRELPHPAANLIGERARLQVRARDAQHGPHVARRRSVGGSKWMIKLAVRHATQRNSSSSGSPTSR